MLVGGDGDDILRGGAGTDTLDGGAGFDVAVFEGALSDYAVERDGGVIRVTRSADATDTDTLQGVEALRFTDRELAVDALPVGSDQNVVSAAYTPVLGQLVASDDVTAPAGLVFELVSGPSHGTLNLSPDGSYEFVPDAGYVGADTFRYRVVDGDGLADVADVTVSVVGPRSYAGGAEQRVNTATAGDQLSPSIAVTSDGGYVVVWASDGQDGSGLGVYGQRYDGSGVAVGTEFLVNSYTTSHQQTPVVEALPGGGFVVVWDSNGQDGSDRGIYGQRYDAAGVAVGPEFLVNGTTAGRQRLPEVASLEDGGFVVSWTSQGQDGSGEGVYAQRYDAAGVAVGTEFLVNGTTAGTQRSSSALGLGDGGFVVAWSSFGQDGSQYGVYGQRYDASGVAVGSEFLINGTTLNDQDYVDLALLSDGGFVAIWTSFGGQDGSEGGIYGQRFDGSGVAVGSEFRVNSTTLDYQMFPSVVGLADGGFVVAWQSNVQDGSQYGIYGQRFDASGVAVDGEFRLNDTTALGQTDVALAGFANGHFVSVWTSNGQDGGGRSVESKVYEIDGYDLTGTAGADTLHGSTADDVLTGNAGDDTFVFVSSLGTDRITDFAVGAGSDDIIELRGLSLSTFSAVTAAATQVGADTVIDLGADGSITLAGVDVANLHEDDFRFV